MYNTQSHSILFHFRCLYCVIVQTTKCIKSHLTMLSQYHSLATKDLDPYPHHNLSKVTTGSIWGPQVVPFNQQTYCSHLMLTPFIQGGGKRGFLLSITNITEQGRGKKSYLSVYNATLNLSFTYQLIQFIITVRDLLSGSIITDPQVCERFLDVLVGMLWRSGHSKDYHLITDTPRYCVC